MCFDSNEGHFNIKHLHNSKLVIYHVKNEQNDNIWEIEMQMYFIDLTK